MNDPAAGSPAIGPVVLVEDRTGESFDGETLGELLAAVLRSEGVSAAAEVGLLLVDAHEMDRLNLETMGKHGPTDVLSFPIDGNSGGPDDDEPSHDPTLPQLVGDVVLCPQVAMANAPSHAGTIDDEFRLLVVHGGLHLCGWDHSTPDEQGAMWLRERELMDQLGVSPSRDPWADS